MNVVSGTDLWTFMSSNGGITAGRRSADWALFQYETDDRVTASAENTGSKTLVRISGDARCWEPFSIRSEAQFSLERNLYKNRVGNSVVFEEINHDWRLRFRWRWTAGVSSRGSLENLKFWFDRCARPAYKPRTGASFLRQCGDRRTHNIKVLFL